MTEEKFAALVQRLDFYARREPKNYRIQVGLLAVLGYVFIFFILGVLLALTGALIAVMIRSGSANVVSIKLGFFLLVGVALILRSLWVTIPPPTEPEIGRAEAPRLFAMLDEVADALRAPRFHHVQMTRDFNAGVLQVPKLGLLGWQVGYLQIGLPLMQALTPEQFRAVIAHEMGHLSANHSRFSGWIYRIRLTWFQLLNNLEGSGHKAAFLFTAFFHWYAPYFAAYSFVLARADEYVADRAAADVSGAQVMAEALLQTNMQGRFFATVFWPDLLDGARTTPTPPASPLAALVSAFKGTRHADADVWYDEALEEKAALDDTHPALSERLASLGFRMTPGGPMDLPKPPLSLPAPPAVTAAETYLGTAQARFAPALDADWKQKIAKPWTKEYQGAQLARRKLDLLDAQAASEGLSPQERWERASLTGRLHGMEHATSLIYEIIQAQPENAAASYALGKVLVKQGDPQGVPFLERAIAMTSEAAAPGNALLYAFARRQGRMREAAEYRERAKKAEHVDEAGRRERADIGPQDSFLPHDLPADELTRFRGQLGQFAQVGRAYLVRKKVKYLADKPLYVLAVLPTGGGGPELAARLGPKLAFPGETVLLVLVGDLKKLEGPIAKVPGALLLQR